MYTQSGDERRNGIALTMFIASIQKKTMSAWIAGNYVIIEGEIRAYPMGAYDSAM